MPHVLLSHRHLSHLLKQFRVNRGLTQQQVAEKLWINIKTAAARETPGRDMLTRDMLATLALYDYDVVLQKARRPGARPTGTGWPT